MQEMRVRYLGGENPAEKEMATLSSILAWKIPWIKEPRGLYSPWGCKRIGHDLVTKQQQISTFGITLYPIVHDGDIFFLDTSFHFSSHIQLVTKIYQFYLSNIHSECQPQI